MMSGIRHRAVHIMSITPAITVGMNNRQFAANWRPITQDIDFAALHGFSHIQFHGTPTGVTEDTLGTTLQAAGAALRTAGVGAVMEIIIRLGANGRLLGGERPLALLESNLPAIDLLGCTRVHWHPIHMVPLTASQRRELEHRLTEELHGAVGLAEQHGVRFGLEHNEPAVDFFSTPESIAAALEQVPGLSFVWDVNHTPQQQLGAFLAFAPRMSLLHIADTPLPELNHHLALGRGSIDLPTYLRGALAGGYHGPAILEIGGLPRSGGYGQDTNAALISSRAILLDALTPLK